MMKVLVTPRSFGKNNPALFSRLDDAGLSIIRTTTGGVLSESLMKVLLAPCLGVILGIDPLNARVLEVCPDLQAVSRYGVGLDNIDLELCRLRGIKVSRTLGANSGAVADYAFALMLAVARRLVAIDQACHRKDWSKTTSIDVHGKTLGIIGLGAIGKLVARRARGFDMRVLAHDIDFDREFARQHGIEGADVDTIVREADFISLHAVLNDKTRNIIDQRRLSMMKKTAVLINTARGALVDEEALLCALQQGTIYGAGIDAFEHEPPQNPAWYALDNLIMGSHCAASTLGATETMGRMAVDNLLRDLGLDKKWKLES